MVDEKKLVENYLHQKSWKVKESSSVGFSYGGLCKSITAEVCKQYWLNHIYDQMNPKIKEAHQKGEFHIHDLGGLTLYCCGYSLSSVLAQGIQGIPNIPISGRPKHFKSALAQVANIITLFQSEIMGAVAFNSFDTYLAPYVKEDGLSYKEVKQMMQGFVFQVNSNTRQGAEPAFFNLSIDKTPPKDLVNQPAYMAGVKDYTYKDCQSEMDMINQAYEEVMMQGDEKGQPFSYPIPTYNVGKRFDWTNPKVDPLFDMAGKFGYPYFANFLNSDMDESDARSMCCRLRLDLTELKKRNGGLFGSGDNTGSIGVVTVNLPRIAYQSKNKSEFFSRLDVLLDLASESLEIKRKFLNEVILPSGLLPAFSHYVGTLKNHFSTIGEIGKNEMCLNLLGEDITTENGKAFALEVGEHIRKRIQEIQKETGNLYNYEATPAESTCYRLAKKDKSEFPDIITQGERDVYYTNSCHIPVKDIKGINETFKHQEDLQCQYTGGTVIHIFTKGRVSGQRVKEITKTLLETYKVPYVSWSPLTKFCPDHGPIDTEAGLCPICKKTLKQFQKITGYLREVGNYNNGKAEEFRQRNQLEV